ncbi:MAG TPA: hypothetical protein VGG64_14400 [Pirellulales bacterium]
MKYQMVALCLFLGVTGCQVPLAHNLPPAEQIMHPGPGVDGPGPGVMMPPGGSGGLVPFPGATSQIAFVGPEAMSVAWDVGGPGAFDSEPLIVPGRYNFPQGAIYRLKLTSIPGRAGVELYPTLEVAPTLPRTDAYLAHNAVPFQLTDEDFDQVLSGNFVTKVIYLPDAEFQELALAGVETLVSTRLDPGVDPIVEADRRGSILAIIRIGNKDLQIPGGDGGGYAADAALAAAGMACGLTGGPGSQMPPELVSGMTAPQYGMPISGTPIGLPGPPHIPLGVPAGLQKHVMRNHTFIDLPNPVAKVRIDVKQKPGMSYPKPASHAHIEESVLPPPALYSHPLSTKLQLIGSGPIPPPPVAAACDDECATP